MDQHPIGFLGDKNAPHAAQYGRRQVNQILFRPHQRQIMIRRQLKEIENLGHHIAVLTGDTEDRAYRPSGSQRLGNRRHLDRFWPGSENDQNFHLRMITYRTRP